MEAIIVNTSALGGPASRRPVIVEVDRRTGQITQRDSLPARPTPETGAGAQVGRQTGFGPLAQEAAVVARAAPTAPNSGAATTDQAEASAPAAKLPGGAASEQSANPDGLTEAEREMVEKLQARDAEVRRHEEAHARVGGAYAGQPSYTYQQGPDGRRYAIGGSVPIDVAPIAGDPEATIAKMDIVKRAALAPAEPSSTDRRVAALADAQRREAVSELAEMRMDALTERLAGDEADPAADQAAVQRLVGLAEVTGRGADSEPGERFALVA
ncbi:MAG: putative metalloprotease CJM1_0395 family protein [Pseudomonadota bacterium]